MAKLHTLVDNFNDNSIDTGVWTVTAGVAETGGRMVLTPSTTTRSIAAAPYDITSSYIIAHIPVVTATGSTGTLQCGMAVSDGADQVAIRKIGSQLLCSKVVAGVTTDLSFTPYSSSNHLYWRIRADASNVYWETSATGSGWFIQNTASLGSIPITWTAVGVQFYTVYTGVEASPGTFAIESINAIYAQNTVGLLAPSFTSQAVTNSTTTVHAITGSAATATTGSASLSIISGGTSARNLAGLLAPGFTNELVTNSTTTTALSISASALTTFTGSARLALTLAISATGTSGRGVTYDGDIPYDSETSYDPNFTAGSAALTVLPPGATGFVTASGTTTFVGSASLTVLGEGGISAGGTTLFTGDALLTIPIVGISASGTTVTTGSARLLTNRQLFGAGFTSLTGTGSLRVLTGTFMFEPPIAYDLPPTLPGAGIINSHARWKGGQRRGRSVLKYGSSYTVVDTPTVDQTNTADKVYQGGHVYTIDADEAFALIAAGFDVIGTVPEPPRPPTSGFPATDLYPAETLFPAS